MSNISTEVLEGWSVLVVDDDPYSLQIASIILSRYGAKVHTAPDGEQGLKAASEVKPRFIISDLSMPILDGWAMIERLKKNRETADIPVIALTAHAMAGDRERAMSAGCHNFMTKPLTPTTFIRDLLGLLMDVDSIAAELKTRGF